MRIGPYARVLLVLVVALTAISLFATERALYYRSNPRVEVKRSTETNTVYARFDPNRDQAYTCTTQKVVDNVGMVCESPDGNVSINCTVATGDTDPSSYFC